MPIDLVCRPPREDLDAAEYVALYHKYIDSLNNAFSGGALAFSAGVVGDLGYGDTRCVEDVRVDGAVVSSVGVRLGVQGAVAEQVGESLFGGGGRGSSVVGGEVPAAGGGGAECGGTADVDGVKLRGDVTPVCVGEVVDKPAVQCFRGPNWERNRQWKEKKKSSKDRRSGSVPEWRRSASALPSLSGSVRTVSTECADEIEAKRTLAARRVAENKVAEALARHRLASMQDVEKTKALQQLAVVRVEERINTVRAKSQASYKKCGSPLESVGSAASAGEFAWKQEIRKREALKVERDYLEQQLVEMLKHASPEARQAVADIPEPYIPSLAEIEAEDEDISPFWSQEEMEADAARYAHG